MNDNGRGAWTGPTALPIVRYQDKQYFVDLRLREFRDVSQPWQIVRFDEPLGQTMCGMVGVQTCKLCLHSVIAPEAKTTDMLRCMYCYGRL